MAMMCRERDSLFERYGKAVEAYQSVVFDLDQAANSGLPHLHSVLLKTADAAKEHLCRCRSEYETHYLQHGCQAAVRSAAAA